MLDACSFAALLLQDLSNKLSNLVSVWTYSFITEDERKKREEELKKRDSDKSLKHLFYNHESVLYEVDCNNRMKKIKKLHIVTGIVTGRRIY